MLKSETSFPTRGHSEVTICSLNMEFEAVNWTQTSSLLIVAEEQELILFFISLPFGAMGLVGCGLMFSTIAKSKDFWKPRTIFEAFSVLNSFIGMFLGVYGLLFTLPRSGIVTHDILDQSNLIYLFLFHRFLLLGGDLFTSLDRCIAVVLPLKYHTNASPGLAAGKLPL